MNNKEAVEAQRKRTAWHRVKQLADEALVLLVAADEGWHEQAVLIRLSEKAAQQEQLWTGHELAGILKGEPQHENNHNQPPQH
jgi:hypothetical protein